MGSVAFIATLVAVVRYLHRQGARRAVAGARQALLLLCYLPQHLSLLRVLSHPQCAHLPGKYPLLPFVYLDKYVAFGLPLAARRSIFVSHFRFLQRRFAATFLESLDSSPLTLWQRSIGPDTFDVSLALNYPAHREGDLLLIFRMNGVMTYRLMFVFAPGRHFGLPDETVIVVAAVQGVPDFERVRSATRQCCDIQPAHILMAALGALAETLGISSMVGLHQSRQLLREHLKFAYDRFFEIYGPEIAGQEAYLMQVPYVEKPITYIERSHRRRSLRKRAFKAETRAHVAAALRRHLA